MAVGIEITSRAVRVVRLAGRRPGPGDRAAEASLPPSGWPLPEGELRKLMQECGAPAGPVGVAVPAAWCHFRRVCFPYRRAGRVEKTVTYALEGRLPGSVEDFVIEPAGALERAGEDGSRLLVAACPKARVKTLLDDLRAAGIDPALVQPAPMSAAAVLAPDEDGTLLLRVDDRCEGAVLTAGGMAAALFADLDGIDVAAQPTRVAERIELAVKAHQLADGSAPFSRVLLSAPEACAGALAGEIERRLGVTTRCVAAPEARWAAAAGVAMQCAGASHQASTLRRGEFVYRPHARRREMKAAAALVLGIGIAGVLAGAGVKSALDARGEVAALNARKRQAFVEITGLGGVTPTFMQAEAALKAARESSRRGQSGRTVSALLRWADFMRVAPDRVSVRFDSIDISPRRLIFTARVQDTATAERLKAAVESSPRFTASSYNLGVKTEGNATFYVLDMELGYKR